MFALMSYGFPYELMLTKLGFVDGKQYPRNIQIYD